MVRDLATRGAQIVLLTQHSLSDPFLVEFIQDVRSQTNNQLLTAEQVDLASLHSIRRFATKWIDNVPPRRLDMVVLCANTTSTASARAVKEGEEVGDLAEEGVERIWQVNYLANFHLLSILSPAIRAQPPDRDVRIIIGACSSYLSGDLLHITHPSSSKPFSKGKPQPNTQPLLEPTRVSPANAFPTSKFALTAFALALQKHLSSYTRPDKFPMNAKVLLVDPGLCRTPGTRRWLTWGSLLGLLLYLLTYPVWWLVLKSPDQGAQSFLYAAMDQRFSLLAQSLDENLKETEKGGWYIKECAPRKFGRKDVTEEETQKKLWDYSERMIEEAEKQGASRRARDKKEAEDAKDEAEAVKELQDYKAKVGKKDGQKQGGSRRSRKAG